MLNNLFLFYKFFLFNYLSQTINNVDNQNLPKTQKIIKKNKFEKEQAEAYSFLLCPAPTSQHHIITKQIDMQIQHTLFQVLQ